VKAPATNVAGIVVGSVVVVAVAALAEVFLQDGPGGSLLLSMAFWLAVAEGAIALVAAAEVARGTWHHDIKATLLSAYPMIPVIAVLFIAFIPQMRVYPWWGSPHFWAQKWLFITRHFVWMMLTFLIARRFAREALRGTDASRKWGVFYLLFFALGQTLVGLEWVMSLEKPWFSTLFGAYFIVEAFQSGIAVAAVVLFFLRDPPRGDEKWRFAQKSVAGLLFGFSIFWAYLYFTQMIVIWYGNLPEEVGYLSRRIGYHTPYWGLARVILGMCWVLPFVVLMPKRAKLNPRLVVPMAVIILVGFFLEKWLMIGPAVRVGVGPLSVETVALGLLLVTVMRSGRHTLPVETPGRVSAAEWPPA
jgi:hypothetical protein